MRYYGRNQPISPYFYSECFLSEMGGASLGLLLYKIVRIWVIVSNNVADLQVIFSNKFLQIIKNLRTTCWQIKDINLFIETTRFYG